jgi:maleate isomerase
VPVFVSFNEPDDSKVARITPASVRRGVETILARASVDAVFVSCTSVRLAEAARTIEAETGVPVTSSNHAMAWHALRLAGVNDPLPQWGRLFETQIA